MRVSCKKNNKVPYEPKFNSTTKVGQKEFLYSWYIPIGEPNNLTPAVVGPGPSAVHVTRQKKKRMRIKKVHCIFSEPEINWK